MASQVSQPIQPSQSARPALAQVGNPAYHFYKYYTDKIVLVV